MPEACRVLWKNKFWIFDASSWLFYTKLITLHGHLNIKQIFCVEFCVFRAVHRFDFRLVINEERSLLHALIQIHAVDRIYMFSPRQSSWMIAAVPKLGGPTVLSRITNIGHLHLTRHFSSRNCSKHLPCNLPLTLISPMPIDHHWCINYLQ